MSDRPHVVVLGGNFAGLGSAQKIREFAGDAVDITVIDRKAYLLFVPNIPAEVFENRNPARSMHMDILGPLADDAVVFVQGEVMGIDPDTKTVDYVPSERPGAAPAVMRYDYLVVAFGARLAYDNIEGFAEFGHTLSDGYYGERLRRYLHEDYKGGPIAIGSARFHQGNGADGLQPYPGGSIPRAEAACEGPPVESMLAAATWLKAHGKGGPDKVTVFTPAKLIAEDAGETVVNKLLGIAGDMGFHYVNETRDIARLDAEGIEFQNGQSLEAEVKIIFPDWVPHDFMQGLPIVDDVGFVTTDLLMRNPKYPEVLAAGDAAAVTVPKLGAIGHQETEIVGRQIAKDVGRMSAEEADQPLAPIVYCIGDMGANQAFYIRSNTWYGGDTAVLTMGHVPFMLKMQYKILFFKNRGKMPGWGLDAAQFMAERLFAA
ncbi:MAG: FAD-dependent oxidoreductase [Gammaproteobacteria bacterium]|jgi:sulfide:quinone oxidoreductase